MVEQITELLRKYVDLKLRDDTEVLEHIETGKLYIIQRSGSTQKVLEVVAKDGELKVEDVPLKTMVELALVDEVGARLNLGSKFRRIRGSALQGD